MRFGVGVEDGDAEAIRLGGRQDQRKLIIPKLAEANRQPQAAGVGKRGDPLPMRRQRLRKRADRARRIRIDHAHAMALNGGDRRQRPHLPQALDRAERQIEPRRVETIDDIEIVIAGKDEHAFGERRMQLHRIEELRPFGCDSGVGHVAGDQDEIQRAGFVNRLDAFQDTREAQTTTTALASVGTIRPRTSNRSAAVPIQRDAGQTAAAITTATMDKMMAAAAELVARKRARVLSLAAVLSMRSAR